MLTAILILLVLNLIATIGVSGQVTRLERRLTPPDTLNWYNQQR